MNLGFFSDDEEEVLCQESEVTKEMLDEYLVRLATRELLDFVCKSALSILGKCSRCCFSMSSKMDFN